MQPRSIMFVSPLSERHLAKAPQSGADAIQLDLEDAITPADKPAARARLAEAIAGLRRGGVGQVVVRVNAPWLLAIEDITAAVAAGAPFAALCEQAAAELGDAGAAAQAVIGLLQGWLAEGLLQGRAS